MYAAFNEIGFIYLIGTLHLWYQSGRSLGYMV